MDSSNNVKKRQRQIHTFFQKKLKAESEKNSDVQVTQVTQIYNDSNSKNVFTQSDVSVNNTTIDCENIAHNQCNMSNMTSTSEGNVLVTMTDSDIGLIIGRPRHQAT
ncbi:uncharacterized protein LOC111028313 isoform X2 [Myzus persicae]|uniref:uncharacterized protein LOC111028313 isoform X2 n=1 Tax=Myzus persicae TaxID=13164 RepID=UPI000B93678D|nr:uncharacterized protein LOC111028313 isoform X2 [Myzus persicae]